MNVEFCKDNSDRSRKVRYFRQIKGERPPGPFPGSASGRRLLRCLRNKGGMPYVASRLMFFFLRGGGGGG